MQSQAQAPRQIERVVKKVRETTITLEPRNLEVLTAASARRLLYRIYRTLHPYDVQEEFLHEARAITNELIFIAYLAGMKVAAREFEVYHISPTMEDWQRIEQLRAKYRVDVESIIKDMIQDALVDRTVDIDYYVRRSDTLVQMSIWTAYNRGKLSVYRVENKRQATIAQAANYAYLGWFMIKTAADERVCELCASLAGDMTQDLDSLDLPPWHSWCRCEVIAIPTVPEYEEQLEFKQEYQTEQVISESI